MNRLLSISLVIALVACAGAEPSTAPPVQKSLRDCTEILFETCGIPPHIDSISPNEAGYNSQFGPMVCVYGRNLSGGSVFFDETYQATSGCGDGLFFTVPSSAGQGQHSVTVITEYGESNAVTFTKP